MRAPASLTGVVLCGGESRRMGSDKGLLQKDGRPWALHMADKLSRWKLPVLFSINERQREGYGALVPSGGWVVDSRGLGGPLEGVLSVHNAYPQLDLFVLACDMLDVDERTVSGLLDAYRRKQEYDFFAYGENISGRFLAQPLCAIYTAAGLSAVASAAAAAGGKTADLSLQKLLQGARTFRLPIDDPDAFRNYNR